MASKAYCGHLMSVTDTNKGKGILINSGKNWYTLTPAEFQEDIDEVMGRISEKNEFYLWYDYNVGGDIN